MRGSHFLPSLSFVRLQTDEGERGGGSVTPDLGLHRELIGKFWRSRAASEACLYEAAYLGVAWHWQRAFFAIKPLNHYCQPFVGGARSHPDDPVGSGSGGHGGRVGPVASPRLVVLFQTMPPRLLRRSGSLQSPTSFIIAPA